jgi:uncharacterized tellurite resistance protein B-like protein
MLATNDPARQAEVGLCVLLAVADGDISEREIWALSGRLGSILGEEFPAMALGAIIEAEISEMSALGPERYIQTLVERLPQERRVRALRGALVVAAADGLAPEETRMFQDVAVELSIDAATAAGILDEVQSGIASSRP